MPLINQTPSSGIDAVAHRVQAIALIYRVLVIGFQLVDCNHMEQGEEYEECVPY